MEMLAEETSVVRLSETLKRIGVRRFPECVSGGEASDAQVSIWPVKSSELRVKSRVLLRVMPVLPRSFPSIYRRALGEVRLTQPAQIMTCVRSDAVRTFEDGDLQLAIGCSVQKLGPWEVCVSGACARSLCQDSLTVFVVFTRPFQ